MKLRTIVIGLLTVLSLSLPVSAQTDRAVSRTIQLTFNDTTANCSVLIAGTKNNYISAVVTLWNGNQCIGTWEQAQSGRVDISEDVSVTKGQSYTLKADYTVDGVTQPQMSTSGTCK